MSSNSRPSLASVRPGLVHRRSLIGFRTACEELWGEPGCRAVVEALAPEVRERTAGILPLTEWIPLADLIAWHVAVWDGPAKRDRAVMTDHAQRTVQHGFGRVKRFLLSMTTPHVLAPKVASMWRDEYSTGTLTANTVDPHSVVLTLRGHEYVEHYLMRGIISEAFRYIVAMTRVRDVTVRHALSNGSLEVVLRWA